MPYTQTMMPHCSLALRSRNRCGSLASALTTGMRQKDIDRDEHGEQIEAPGGHQPELHGQHHKKGQHQAAVVAAPGGRQRDELAQCKERHHGKQHRGRPFAQNPADPEHHHHDPGGSEQALKVALLEAGALRPAGCPAVRAATARRPRLLASARTPNTKMNSALTCCVALMLRRNWFMQGAPFRHREVRSRRRGRGRGRRGIPHPARPASARRRSPSTGSAPAPPRPWA